VVFLLDEVRLGSEDPRGLLGPLEILCIAPGLASVMRDHWGSDSLAAANTSRLLETPAARLADPLDRPKKVELGNCNGQS